MSGDHNMNQSNSGWRKRTIMEMARDCGINFHQAKWPELERFAELVRADEAEKYKWDVHSCGPTCERYACVATREAVLAEREACAQACEKRGMVKGGEVFAARIRARGQA
jgi:hypothetical protein